MNDRNQLSNEIDGKCNNNYGNTIINILKSNDKVNLNNIHCYYTNNNNTEPILLTTKQIIYTYSCGHKNN